MGESSEPRRSLLGKLGWHGAGSLIRAVCMFALGVVTSRALGLERQGAVDVVVAAGQFAAIVGALAIPRAATRFVAATVGEGDPERARGLATWLYRRLLLALIPVSALIGWIGWSVGVDLTRPIDWVLAAAYCAAFGLSQFQIAACQGLQKFEASGKYQASIGASTLAIVLVVGDTFGPTGVLVAYLVGEAIPGLASLGWLRGRAELVDAALGKRLLAFCLPAWGAIVLGAIGWSRFEIFFIEGLGDDGQVAFFSRPLAVAMVLPLLVGLLGGFLLPYLSERMAQRGIVGIRDPYRTGMRLYMTILVPTNVALAATPATWLPWLFGEEFAPGAPVATVLFLFSTWSALGFGTMTSYAIEKPRLSLVSNLVSAPLLFVLCFFLVPAFGALGAAYARGAAQSVAGIIEMVWLTALVGERRPILDFVFSLVVGCVVAVPGYLVQVASAGVFPVLLATALGALLGIGACAFAFRSDLVPALRRIKAKSDSGA